MSDMLIAVNAGSSSLKVALFDVSGGRPVQVLSAAVEGLGELPTLRATSAAGDVLAERAWPAGTSDDALFADVLAWLDGPMGGGRLIAAGHRVVHGGADLTGPRRVDAALLAQLDALVPLAPLHQPHNVAPMRLLERLRPGLAQVACFDTAFHRTMPPVATRYAIPREIARAGVRRYGFHGLSYAFVAGHLAAAAPALARGRVVVAHLGNGASLCALRDGASIDTTMGFSALDGLVMGTRCGTIDPGVLLYLQQARGMRAADLETLLYKQSGLLGVSGFASDMRRLQASDDPRAREAVELFAYRVAREAGALVASLAGLDGLVFTAGIGEHDAAVRANICARLAWLGIALDPASNAAHADVISDRASRVEVRVVHTDEDAVIARETMQVIGRA